MVGDKALGSRPAAMPQVYSQNQKVLRNHAEQMQSSYAELMFANVLSLEIPHQLISALPERK